MKYNIPERVVRDIIEFAKKNHVKKIVLFGSRARGNHTERSDIDLAVSGGDFDGFYWDVKENVHSLLSIDTVEFDCHVQDELKKEIERDGIVLYEEA